MRSALLTSSCARSETRGEETSFPLYTTGASQKRRETLVAEVRAKRLLLPAARWSPHGVRHQRTPASRTQQGFHPQSRHPSLKKQAINTTSPPSLVPSGPPPPPRSSAPRLGPALILVSPLHLHIRPPLDHSSQEKKTVSVLSVFFVRPLFPTQYSVTALYTVPAFF